jgi:plastocyanin
VWTNYDSAGKLDKTSNACKSILFALKTSMGEGKMKKYNIFAFVALAGVMVMVAGCTSSSNPSPGPVTSTASQNNVSIQNYSFSPSMLTIQKGANVTWKNSDSVQHTVVSDSPAFSSPLLNTGDSYTFQFNSTGTYSYHCSLHTYMKGTITVV